MKNLLRLSTVMLGLGMLGAAACSSCMPPPEETKPKEYKQSYTCGPGTHREGNQCVGDVQSTTSRPQATAIPAAGNN